MSSFIGRREIKELPEILWEDEKVEKIIQGTYNNGNGILVCSSKRLIFIDKGLLYGLKVEDFPLDKVSSIQYKTGLLLGKLTIYSSGNKAIIDNVDKKQIRAFSDYVTTKLNSKGNEAGANDESKDNDVIGQLEKLSQLKEKGILTEEEFDKAKAKILNT